MSSPVPVRPPVPSKSKRRLLTQSTQSASGTPAPQQPVTPPPTPVPVPGNALPGPGNVPNPATPTALSLNNPFAEARREVTGTVGEFRAGTGRKRAGLVWQKAGAVRERTVDAAAETYELPGAFEELAEAAQVLGTAIGDNNPDTSDVETFADVEGASQVLGAAGGLSLLSDLTGMFTSGKDLYGGGTNLRTGWTKYDVDGVGGRDSITRNLGAQQMESGVTGLLFGGSGAALDVMDVADLATDFVPFVGGAKNIAKGAVDTKGAIEDSVASERMRRQKVRVKRDLDQQLPMTQRLKRFDEFLVLYQKSTSKDAVDQAAARKGKRSDYKRFKSTLEEYPDRGAYQKFVDPDAGISVPAKTDFLNWLKSHKVTDKKGKSSLDAIKDFGFGTDIRTSFQEEFKQNRDASGVVDPGHEQYDNMRSLGKVASFGHRRKAETATMHAVDAVGNTADGVGDFTAAADYGATKLVGKSIKAVKAGYTATKKAVKRGRRVHKLRTAKNELEYGSKTDRGALWGAKTFFTGNVSDQMAKARASMGGDEARDAKGAKSANIAGMSDKRKRELLRQLTLQCERRIDQLIACLLSPDESVRYRAKRIIHIVAETNLAGTISRIYDSDLDRLREHYLRANNLGPDNKPLPAPPAPVPGAAPVPGQRPAVGAQAIAGQHLAQYNKQLKSLHEIISRQLAGVGG